MKELIKLSAGTPPGPESPPVDSLEAVRLVVRGPAGPAEGEEAERKKPGRPHKFPSRDIRKVYMSPEENPPPSSEEEMLSASRIITMKVV